MNICRIFEFFLVFPQFILITVAFAKLFFTYSSLFYLPHVYAKKSGRCIFAHNFS